MGVIKIMSIIGVKTTGCGNSIGVPLMHSYVVEGTPILLPHPVNYQIATFLCKYMRKKASSEYLYKYFGHYNFFMVFVHFV